MPDMCARPKDEDFPEGEDVSRTYGETRDCNGCRFWSEMIARALGRGVEALCMAGEGTLYGGKYTLGRQTCDAWKSGHHGAVDDPPNYGEETRALYDAEDQAK